VEPVAVPAPAPAAQAQAAANGMVAPQRQQQAQLAFVQAANQVNAQLEQSGTNPMTILPRHARAGSPVTAGGAIVCVGAVVLVSAAAMRPQLVRRSGARP
jgi:hypothetical protein